MSTTTNPSTLNYSTKSVGPRTGPVMYGGLSLQAWLAIGIVALLMVATFRFNLVRLWGKTNPFWGEGDWAHAVVVPIIGLYYLYVHRDELLKAKVQPLLAGGFRDRMRWLGAAVLGVLGTGAIFVGPAIMPQHAGLMVMGGRALLGLGLLVGLMNWGLATTVFGLVFFAYGIYPGQNDYIKDLGMVATLFGVVLTLCGWQVMRVAWFPIVFLICALPWPGLFYSWVAGPLQELAARVAVWVLQVTGIEAFHSGTKIHMGSGATQRTLNVAEACAGLKSLMTFVTVAAAVAFLNVRPMWQKLFLVAMAVPIAIFCNVMRVSGQGLLDHYAGSQWSENFAHAFVGMVMLVPAFFLILLLGWILDMLFVEEADEESSRAAAVASGATKAMAGESPVVMAGVPVAAVNPVPVSAVKANAAQAIAARTHGETGPARAPATGGLPPASRPVNRPNPMPTPGGPKKTYVPPAFVPPVAETGGGGGGGGTTDKEKTS